MKDDTNVSYRLLFIFRNFELDILFHLDVIYSQEKCHEGRNRVLHIRKDIRIRTNSFLADVSQQFIYLFDSLIYLSEYNLFFIQSSGLKC